MDSYVFTVFSLCVLTNSLIKVLGQCSFNKFGPDCRYDCHCKPEVTCDPVSGCPGKCANGWDGPTCQRQNVALNRSASQSPSDVPASNAVDGRITQGYWSCASTSANVLAVTSQSMWNVILDHEYNIRKLIIYLRTDCCRDRINGFTVSVGQTSKSNNNYRLCYKDNTTSRDGPNPIIQIQCSSPLRGDVVRIRTQKTTPLTLCEVIVPVCAPGSWGEDCGKPCGYCYNNNACSEVNGHCPVIGRNPRCMVGYMEAKCLTKCTRGTYGPDCNSTCGFCAEGVSSCDIVSGNCPVHNQTTCYSGYHGIRCDSVCNDRTWGPDCKITCGHCWKNMACNKSTGVCPVTDNMPRCSAGYRAERCSVACESERWGEDCTENCSVNCVNQECDGTTGVCLDCVSGYEGDKCETLVTTPENNPSGSVNTGIIVGGVVGALAVVGLTVLGTAFILTKYRRQPNPSVKSDRNREVVQVGEYVNAQKTGNRNITEANQSEDPQYETVDNHDYGEIRHSAIGEDSKYTSLTLGVL